MIWFGRDLKHHLVPILPEPLGPCCLAGEEGVAEGREVRSCSSTTLLVLMGWWGEGRRPLASLSPSCSQPNRDGLPELVAGGFFYCLGMVFFKSDGRVPFAHAIWHLFVAIGAGIHYYAIWRYLYRPGALDTKTSR